MYKFKHEMVKCKINPIVFTAFDERYSAKRTLYFDKMFQYFTSDYIARYKSEISKKPLSQCWPEFCKILWTVENGKLYSQIKTMKTMQGLTLGQDIKEEWTFAGSMVSGVVECED